MKTYNIWKINLFIVGAVWSELKGFGQIKARTDKEAQYKVDRKMRAGRHEGHCFKAVLVT